MVSLGQLAYADKLQCNDIASDSVTCSHHKYSGDVALKQEDSMLYVRFDEQHQCTQVEAASGNSQVEWTIGVAHNLSVGDTVHVGSYGAGPDADMRGIPHAKLQGTFLVTAVGSSTKFSVESTVNATSSGVGNQVSAVMKVERYKYLDLHSSGAAWAYSTVKPSAGHTNESFFS